MARSHAGYSVYVSRQLKPARFSRGIDKRKSVLTSTTEEHPLVRFREVGRACESNQRLVLAFGIHLNLKHQRHICRLVFSIRECDDTWQIRVTSPDILLLSFARASMILLPPLYETTTRGGSLTGSMHRIYFPYGRYVGAAYAAHYSQYRISSNCVCGRYRILAFYVCVVFSRIMCFDR